MAPACMHMCVPVLGASLPQPPDGDPSGYLIVTVARRPEDGGLPAAFLFGRPDPFISSFNPCNPTDRQPVSSFIGQETEALKSCTHKMSQRKSGKAKSEFGQVFLTVESSFPPGMWRHVCT